MNTAFFLFVVEQVYLHPEVFEFMYRGDTAETAIQIDPEPLKSLNNLTISANPIKKIKKIVLKAALDVWDINSESLGRKHLAALVEQVLQFGADLIAAALRNGALYVDGDRNYAFGHYVEPVNDAEDE